MRVNPETFADSFSIGVWVLKGIRCQTTLLRPLHLVHCAFVPKSVKNVYLRF